MREAMDRPVSWLRNQVDTPRTVAVGLEATRDERIGGESDAQVRLRAALQF